MQRRGWGCDAIEHHGGAEVDPPMRRRSPLLQLVSVVTMTYDPWSATQLAQRLSAEGVPAIEFRSSKQNFSEPTKELDAAMRAHRLRHDGNPVLEWCIGNVVGRYDARSNMYPKGIEEDDQLP